MALSEIFRQQREQAVLNEIMTPFYRRYHLGPYFGGWKGIVSMIVVGAGISYVVFSLPVQEGGSTSNHPSGDGKTGHSAASIPWHDVKTQTGEISQETPSE